MTAWFEDPKNIRTIMSAFEPVPGGQYIWHVDAWALSVQPDDPGCTLYQFRCKNPQVVTFVRSCREKPAEWWHVTCVDENGMPRLGWVGRWQVRPGSAEVYSVFTESYDVRTPDNKHSK